MELESLDADLTDDHKQTVSSSTSRSRFAFERQIKFLSPPIPARSFVRLWKEVFSAGGTVVRVYRLAPWTFIEYPSVEEADAAFQVMKEKNVVGSLYRTNELERALKGLDPFVPVVESTEPRRRRRPAFHRQLKFLTKDCADASDEDVKGMFHSAGIVSEILRLGLWTFVQFKSPEKARAALISMKQLNEGPPSIRETNELTQYLGPPRHNASSKFAFHRQLKLERSSNENVEAEEIQKQFEAGGTVDKIYSLGRWTFVEYPSTEEAEAAFNILSKKAELKKLYRTEELVKALLSRRRSRQLRISKINHNDDDKELLEQCRSPDAAPVEAFSSGKWTFLEFATPADAETVFHYLRDNQLCEDVQRTVELKKWLSTHPPSRPDKPQI